MLGRKAISQKLVPKKHFGCPVPETKGFKKGVVAVLGLGAGVSTVAAFFWIGDKLDQIIILPNQKEGVKNPIDLSLGTKTLFSTIIPFAGFHLFKEDFVQGIKTLRYSPNTCVILKDAFFFGSATVGLLASAICLVMCPFLWSSYLDSIKPSKRRRDRKLPDPEPYPLW